MRTLRLTWPALLVAFFVPLATADVTRLQTPPGFQITELNFAVPNARQMAITAAGTLIVGTRKEGVVYAVPNALTPTPGKPLVIARKLTMPSGVAVANGDLYIGATHEILRIPDIDNNLHQPQLLTVTRDLPDKRHHGWKYLKFGPDQHLYVPVGAPCNICLSDDPRFASILRMHPATGATEIWAHGIRNTVGFDWHPQTGDLWFTDNGRDMLGDDIPAEEINVAQAAGQHFGYPFEHANGLRDPEFGDHKAGRKLSLTVPAITIQAHSAALGMTFYTGRNFPSEYQQAIFVAEHGSWNRSSKVGYQVSVATVDHQGQWHYRPFITGWLQGQNAWGRPNDVLQTADGSLLISDDKRGKIYRVSYTPRPVALQ